MRLGGKTLRVQIPDPPSMTRRFAGWRGACLRLSTRSGPPHHGRGARCPSPARLPRGARSTAALSRQRQSHLNMTLYHRELISLRVLDQFYKLCTQFCPVAD